MKDYDFKKAKELLIKRGWAFEWEPDDLIKNILEKTLAGQGVLTTLEFKKLIKEFKKSTPKWIQKLLTAN